MNEELRTIFVECDCDGISSSSACPIILKPDTLEPYATLEELASMTKDEVMGLIDQFAEDYNLGDFYKLPLDMEDGAYTYMYNGRLYANNYNYKVKFLNMNALYDSEETFDSESLFLSNEIVLGINITEHEHYSIDVSFPDYDNVKNGVYLCYYVTK